MTALPNDQFSMSKLTRFFGGAVLATILVLSTGTLTAQAAPFLSPSQIQGVTQILASFGSDPGTIGKVYTDLGGVKTNISASQTQAILGLISSFGADASVIAKVSTDLAQSTTTPQSTPLIISAIAPTSGSVGTKVLISGSGFTLKNTVSFIAFIGKGNNSGNSPFDGWIEFPNVGSPDGRTLSFTIPAKIPNGVTAQGSAQTLVIPGTYYIKVKTQNGVLSAASPFRVTSAKTSSLYDYNSDNVLNGTDTIYLTFVVSGRVSCPAGKVCDVNGDGYVDVVDVTALTTMITKGTVSLTDGSSQTASALNAFTSATQTTSVPAPTTGFNYEWTQDLQIGSMNLSDVVALQTALRNEGVYGGDITGGFYAQTFAAVKAFQQKYGIDTTGYVGSITRAKLNELY